MNSLEGKLLTHSFHIIYGQMLLGKQAAALRSLEAVITFVRYMTKTSATITTVKEELEIIAQFLQIGNATGNNAFQINCLPQTGNLQVKHGTLVLEMCFHGMELQLSGYSICGLTLEVQNGQLFYELFDQSKTAYGGMINEEEWQQAE